MKPFLAFILILGTQLAFAAPIDEQIKSIAKRIANNTQSTERLTQDEKIQVLKALNNADVVLLRVATDTGSSSGVDPWSSNPGPKNPNPTTRSCDKDSPSSYQESYSKIKNLAFSTRGFDYQNPVAHTFAKEWTHNYPCNYADQYIKNARQLVSFAYSTMGYDKVYAVRFAIANTDKFCANYKIADEYFLAFQFAYKGSGLDMNSIEARDYALNKISPYAFSCKNI